MLRSCLVLGKGVDFATAVSAWLFATVPNSIHGEPTRGSFTVELSMVLRVSLHSRTARIERGEILCRNHRVNIFFELLFVTVPPDSWMLDPSPQQLLPKRLGNSQHVSLEHQAVRATINCCIHTPHSQSLWTILASSRIFSSQILPQPPQNSSTGCFVVWKLELDQVPPQCSISEQTRDPA